jgi:CheY-like chemotaxis protein
LVEDNNTNQIIAMHMLRKLGYAVDVVENGKEALDAIEIVPYALVLMDIQMPVMDGFETTAAIRRRESTNGRHLPIVAMTAHAMRGDRELCLNAGMDDCISKPVHPRDLSRVMDRLLSLVTTAAREEPGSEGSHGETVFNRDLFMDRLGGQEEVARDIIGIFLEDTSQLMENLKQAIQDGDAGAVGRYGHKLKGSSAAIDAEAMRQVAYEIELAGKSNELNSVHSLLKQLEEEFGALNTALSASGLWSEGQKTVDTE